jgi:predicted nuclease of predicted toxin-antitoxin system
MPRTIRFHLDENCHHGIADALRRHGVDVSTTPAAELLGASDEDQLRFAIAHGRAIFTQDKDFLKLAGQEGTKHHGILFCRQQTRSVGEIIRGLMLVWEVYEAEELKNKVEYL